MKVGKYSTSVGTIIVHTTDVDHLCYLSFSETYVVAEGNISPASTVVEKILAAIELGKDYDLPLSILYGTSFQREVWHALRQIPYGQTVSYKDIAMVIGRPLAVRAVGNAIRANPIAVIIPCHRVVGKSNPDAYHWGGEIKRKLLDKEYLATHPTEILLA